MLAIGFAIWFREGIVVFERNVREVEACIKDFLQTLFVLQACCACGWVFERSNAAAFALRAKENDTLHPIRYADDCACIELLIAFNT